MVTSEAYDFKGNLLRGTRQLVQDYKSTPDWSQNPQPVLETEVFASSTRYDALNRPIQMVAPHANQASNKINVIQPGYNEANLLERVDTWLGQTAEPSALLDPPSANLHAVTNIDYDAKGQRTRIDYGNGVKIQYTYDRETFRLASLTSTRPVTFPADERVVQDLSYTYDPTGNITHIQDNADIQNVVFFRNQRVEPSADYTYDAIYRLISATGREHIGQLAEPQTTWNDELRLNLPQPGDGQAMRPYTEQYLYDAVGNFEQLIHQATSGNWTRAYAYNEASLIEAAKNSNRLSSTTLGATTEPYTYDNHGNMTGMPHLAPMLWNFTDQLSATSRQAVNAGTPETTFYLYDGTGQRVRKVTERQNGSRKEERIYLGGFEIYHEFNRNGTGIALERETLHIMDDRQGITLVETRTLDTAGSNPTPAQLIRYQFGNHLGSAILELDEQARIISYEEYTPYGSTSYQAVQTDTPKRYRYTGKERDEESGLYYHGARYYAPWLGRWGSCDPVGVGDGVNAYRYCFNNPIRHLDPSGKQTEEEPVIITRAFLDESTGVKFDFYFEMNAKKEIQRAEIVAFAPIPGKKSTGFYVFVSKIDVSENTQPFISGSLQLDDSNTQLKDIRKDFSFTGVTEGSIDKSGRIPPLHLEIGGKIVSNIDALSSYLRSGEFANDKFLIIGNEGNLKVDQAKDENLDPFLNSDNKLKNDANKDSKVDIEDFRLRRAQIVAEKLFGSIIPANVEAVSASPQVQSLLPSTKPSEFSMGVIMVFRIQEGNFSSMLSFGGKQKNYRPGLDVGPPRYKKK